MTNYLTAAHFILTERCNLRCPYCYVKKKNIDMTEEVAENGIKFLINNAKKENSNKISITFFGGEPTLKLDLMNFILDKTYELCELELKENNYTITPQFTLITNGMIFNDSLAKFIEKWKTKSGIINIQLSFDGDADTQRLTRPAYNNAFDSGARMLENLAKYKELAEKINLEFGKEIYVHSVISKDNINNLFYNYKFFNENGFYGLWHCLVVEDDWDDEDAKVYEEQLNNIFDYNTSLDKDRCIKNFILNKTFRNTEKVTCTAGKSLCSINGDGHIFTCHRWYEAFPEDSLGVLTSNGEAIIDEDRKKFFDDLDDSEYVGQTKCESCKIGGCYRCLAANAEHNLLPNVCFVKYCKMAEVEDRFRFKVLNYLNSIGYNISNNNVNLTTLVKSLNVLKDTIGDGFIDLEDRLTAVEEKQTDILNLLLALLNSHE